MKCFLQMNIIEVIDQGFDIYIVQAKELLNSLIRQYVLTLEAKLLSHQVITHRGQFLVEEMTKHMMRWAQKKIKRIKIYLHQIKFGDEAQSLANRFRKRAREYNDLSVSIRNNIDKVIYILTEKAIQKEEIKYRIKLMGTQMERPMTDMSSFFSAPHNEVASLSTINKMDDYNRSFRDEQLRLMLGVDKKRLKEGKILKRKTINPEETM